MAQLDPSVTAQLKQLAIAAGFSRVGVARAHSRPNDEARLRQWLSDGMHGEMAWLERDPARRCDPAKVVDGAQSVIVLALDYDSATPTSQANDLEGRGWISRYALGMDYHKVAERRLKRLTEAVTTKIVPGLGAQWRQAAGLPETFNPAREFRWSVDYGPVLERQWAQEAGLGWQGKHSLLVDPHRGSYFFLATVITTLPLIADTPQLDHCGSCTACMDACPTDAIVKERVVDARKCISYLTIEKRGELSEEQANALGDHIFGCDICQEVCPFNRFSEPSEVDELAPVEGRVAPRLADLMALDAEGFAAAFRGSAVKRAKLHGLLRNVAAVQTNQRRQQARASEAD